MYLFTYLLTQLFTVELPSLTYLTPFFGASLISLGLCVLLRETLFLHIYYNKLKGSYITPKTAPLARRPSDIHIAEVMIFFFLNDFILSWTILKT